MRGGFVEVGDRVAQDDPEGRRPPRLGTVTAINAGPSYHVRWDSGDSDERGWLGHSLRRIPAPPPTERRGDE